jgi:hypothetical protein
MYPRVQTPKQWRPYCVIPFIRRQTMTLLLLLELCRGG